MECKGILDKLDKYFEGRLSDREVHNIKKHLMKCQQCRKEYEELEDVFNILSTHDIISPPPNFTEMVIKKIESYKKVSHINQKAIISWAASFIAAGILIIFLNIGVFTYDTTDLASSITRGSIEINKKVLFPFAQITRSINELSKNIDFKSIDINIIKK